MSPVGTVLDTWYTLRDAQLTVLSPLRKRGALIRYFHFPAVRVIPDKLGSLMSAGVG